MPPTLATSRIAELVAPFCSSLTQHQLQHLSDYLDLLMKWNSKTNLTAIRDPEQIVIRHFGESLFMAAHLPACHTLLDLGSGAGFPGLPIQIVRPALLITLAESQNKKAAFLREAVRELGFSTQVWAERAETLPVGCLFDVVALRAVDHPAHALQVAQRLVARPGMIAWLTSMNPLDPACIPLPGSKSRCLSLLTPEPSKIVPLEIVPRET